MQASVLCARTGCTNAALKEWRRDGIVIPKDAKGGKGNHAAYDDANLVAAIVALKLKQFGVKLKGLQARFEELHELLRSRSTLEWRGHRILLTSSEVQLVSVTQGMPMEPVVIAIDLDALSVKLVPLETDPQLSLRFGVTAV
jgi:DNA-binding transcriptional MerR regulator